MQAAERGRFAGGAPGRILLAVVLVAGLLRIGAAVLVRDTPPAGDERGYLRRAEAVATGTAEESLAERPPGYAWWGGVWLRVSGGGAGTLRAAGVLTGLVLVALTLRLGRDHAGVPAGVLAASALALLPEQILYDVSLWSESLYGALLLAGVVLVSAASDAAGRNRLRAALAGGLFFGLAALTREAGLIALVAAAGWLAWRASRSDRTGRWAPLVMLGAALAVILPWSVLQSVRAGTPVLVAQTTGQNLFLGNWRLEDPEAETGPLAGPRKRARYESLGATQTAREAEARRLAGEAIAARLPAWPFEKIASEIPDLLAPRSVPSARLAAEPGIAGWPERWAFRLPGAWGAPAARSVSSAATVALWIVLGGAGFFGLVLARGRRTGLLAALVVAHLVPVVVAFGITRFRVPLFPVLAVAAAALALDPRSAWHEASARRRWGAVAALGCFLAALALRWSTLRTPGFG